MYKEHSGVSLAAAALKHAHESNDIAPPPLAAPLPPSPRLPRPCASVASRRVAIIAWAGARFFYRFYFRRLECGAAARARARVYLLATETSSILTPLFLPPLALRNHQSAAAAAAAAIPRGRPTVFPVFIVCCIAKP